jgi:hypothetical protein
MSCYWHTNMLDGFTLFYDNLYQGHIDVAWLSVHGTHKLVPIDEYGRLATQCPERVKCPGDCGYWIDCKLDLGHEGAHQTKVTK